MFGLAAQKKCNGNLIIVSPKDGIEFEVNEDILNIHMIYLGNFCRIGVENNVPISYELVKDGIDDLEVTVKKDDVVVSGVTGILTSGLALFYRTTEFGDVACKDETPGKVGSKNSVLVSRLPEDQRTGMYSRFVWQGVSDGTLEDSISRKLDHIELAKSNEENDDNENDEKSETTEKSSDDVLPKYITGFVSGRNPSNNTSFVTCNLTYPGVDGVAWCTKKIRLDIGEWVEARFSENDFEKYFPPNPTVNTPRFVLKDYKKIEKPANYHVRLSGKTTEVKIRKLHVPVDHKKGGNIEDRFLGTISDEKKLISNGHSIVDVVIRRRKLFKTRDGKFTTWFLHEAKKSATESESSGTERSSSAECRESKKKVEKKRKGRSEKKETKHVEKEIPSLCNVIPQYSMPPGVQAASLDWQMRYPGPIGPMGPIRRMGPMGPMGPIGSIGSIGVIPPSIPSHFFFTSQGMPPMPFPSASSELSNHRAAAPSVDSKTCRKGFKTPIANSDELVAKRAVVTSIKPNRGVHQNGKDNMAFLWLLDDHTQSVYYISSKDGIAPGHFFEGHFAGSGDKWECKKYVKSLGKLIDGIITNDSIELQLTVYDYFPQSPERLNPESQHSFIGKIVDKFNKLPQDCSGGVKIGIKLWNLPERDQWCWVVSKVFQSKHIQLLTEFHQAWHRPGIRHVINMKCLKSFDALRDLLDTETEGHISHAQSQWKNDSKPGGLDSDDDEDSVKHFAWITVHDGDFVRMMVFPRVEGQEMNKMKKNVTDKNIYKKVKKIAAHRLYRVKLNENGDVVEMLDCPQYFSAKKNSEIEFKFVSSDQTLLARNVALVDPIGMPDWLGKLMFCCPDRPITKKKVLLKASFRLLDDSDTFVNDDLVSDEGVCFLNLGSAEKLSNQNFEEVLKEEKNRVNWKEVKHEQNLFRTKLSCLPKETVFSQFVEVCKILRNDEVIEEMKKKNIDTDTLIRLQSSAR